MPGIMLEAVPLLPLIGVTILLVIVGTASEVNGKAGVQTGFFDCDRELKHTTNKS